MAEPLATVSRGAVLDSRYRLVRRLGAGGMASVWLAIDGALGRSVAVKIIAEGLAADPVWVTRFRREVRAVAALSHPNIVRIFDSGSEHGREFLVMEYLPGGTLADVIARERRDGARADRHRAERVYHLERLDHERLARELLSALAHIHDGGVVHRDIKPSNVLLARDGSPRLTDFGIAYAAEASRLTSTGMILGSERYLAPEVLAGARATPPSDLYSLGRLLEELASGHARSTSLSRLVRALTELDPGRRPRSARGALELLERTTRLDPRPRAPSSLRTPAGAPAPAARPRLPSAAFAAAALAALVALVTLVASASGGGAPARARSRAPAQPPPQASLTRQLDAISERISFAAAR